MNNGSSHPPGVAHLTRKLLSTGIGALENRGELLLVELREEEHRVIELIVWAGAVCALGMMFLVVLTGTVIFLFREDLRIYAAGGFCLAYLAGGVFGYLNLRALLEGISTPFRDSIAELKKDREWLESLE